MHLANLNWQEARTALQQKDLIVLVPLGSTEQHGPVGPLGTDFIVVERMAALIEQKCPVLVTPTMPFGVAPHHIDFPGTIDIGPEALYLVMAGVTRNLMRHGARKFLFLNGHGGNDQALDKAGLEVFREGGLCAQINWWSLAPMLNPEWTTGHGDAQEVAMMRALDPALIKDSFLVATHLNNISDELVNTHFNQVRFGKGSVKIIRDVRSTVSTGAFGGQDSSRGTLEWGQAMLAAIVDYCVDFIEAFRKADLEGAHERA